MNAFPSLDGFGPTRRTLQLYVRAVSAIARVHATTRPHWRHISLRVVPLGLLSDNIPLPDGGIAAFRADFQRHQLLLITSSGHEEAFDMTAGLGGTEMGERLLAATTALGLQGEYPRERFAGDEPGVYDRAAVGRFFTALVSADRILKKHRTRLTGESGPVQFWAHGFDLSMERFGAQTRGFEQDGQQNEERAQVNFGFYPGNDDASSYFYSNPWPFEERLTGQPLPPGASWHTEGWQGSILPYSEVLGRANAEARLLDYAGAVDRIAAPLLEAR